MVVEGGAAVVAGVAVGTVALVKNGADDVKGAEDVEILKLKMSTTLDLPPNTAAQGMRLARVINTTALNPLEHPPHTHTHPATPQAKVTGRTYAASEDRDSGIRQRRGCKTISSLAEGCSAPSSSRHAEDVHDTGEAIQRLVRCTRHETGSRRKHNRTQPTRASP